MDLSKKQSNNNCNESKVICQKEGYYPFKNVILYGSDFFFYFCIKLCFHRIESNKEICDKSLAPKIKKTQYRIQMTYLKADSTCHPLGKTTMRSEIGVEKPYIGEDFSYLIWRKRNCCATVPIAGR